MRRIVAGVVLVVLALPIGVSGCAPGGTDAPSAASAAPSPTDLTPEEAGERYLEMVRPYNTVLEQLETAINEGRPLDEQAGLAAATAGALRAEIEGLRATTWPADVQPHAVALADAAEQAVPLWEEASRATTQDALVAAVQAATAPGEDEAAKIRELLALGAYDESDN